MKIWVDADACPNAIKNVLFKAADRTKTQITLVANRYIQVPKSEFISMQCVAQGFDVADNEIVKQAQAGDLVITADIPLADEVLTKDCHALNPRGEKYSKDTIKAKLNMRDFMDSMRDTMRASGDKPSGPKPMGQRDINEFANQLDRFLARYARDC